MKETQEYGFDKVRVEQQELGACDKLHNIDRTVENLNQALDNTTLTLN